LLHPNPPSDQPALLGSGSEKGGPKWPPFSVAQNWLRAVIWDLDGVLVDSGPYHFQAWQALARERGIPFSEADFRATFGQRNPEIIRSLFGPAIPPAEMEHLSQRKEALFGSWWLATSSPCRGRCP